MKKTRLRQVALVLASFLLAGCETLDAIKTKVATAGDYAVPESYDEAYAYRTGSAYKNVVTLLKNKETEALRTTNPYGYVKKLCGEIEATAANDFEKAKMAHDAVCVLISYDAKNFWAGTVPEQDYENVLKTKTAVCEGYANTFLEFCTVLKIRCEKVTGYARGVGTSLQNEGSPTDSNHAWNAVRINDCWYLVDCTWDSGHMEGKNSKQDYNTDWLFLKPEHCIYSHYPSFSKQQLLSPAVTAAEFSALPDLRPKFFDAASAYAPLAKTTTVDGTFSYAFTPVAGYELSFRLADAESGQELQERTFVRRDAAEVTALFSLPKAGTYSVMLFYRAAGDKKGTSCGEFLLQSTGASGVRYPTLFATSAKNVRIISPLKMPLQKGKSAHFEAHVEGKKYVAVICGKQFIQLTNDGSGTFSGDVAVPANVSEVTIAASNSERGGWEGLAKYSVQ